MPDDAYDPADLRVLAGMEPPRRPAGHVEDGPVTAARRREQEYAESVYRPDPAELTPAYRDAWARGLPRHPIEDDERLARADDRIRQARLAAVIEMVSKAPDVPPDPGDELP